MPNQESSKVQVSVLPSVYDVNALLSPQMGFWQSARLFERSHQFGYDRLFDTVRLVEEAGMPRPLRIHVPGTFHHVTLRGNHRQDIFFTAADREIFYDLLREIIGRFGARLHAYCLMTNHVHLLIQVGDAPLGKSMLRIASRYARTLQRRFQTTGHLFERRYHTVLVDVDTYLSAAIWKRRSSRRCCDGWVARRFEARNGKSQGIHQYFLV